MKQPTRYKDVDFIRGSAIVAMIAIHCTAYFLSHPITSFIWNWSQFAVQAFVFCSAYIFFKNPKDEGWFTLGYLKKRVTRLLIPYYFFFVIFSLFLLYLKKPVTLNFILQSLFVVGGVDINWLILLFIQLTLVLPIIKRSYTHKRILFAFITTISVCFSILTLFYNFHIDWKWIMWLGWMLLLPFTLLYTAIEDSSKKQFFALFISCFFFYVSYKLQAFTHHSLIFFDNKYPPNLFFLSYGIGCVLILKLAHTYIISRFSFIQHFFDFFSKHSYSLFFIHYFVIYIVATKFKYYDWPWWGFLLIVLAISIGVQFLLNLGRDCIQKIEHKMQNSVSKIRSI